MRRKGVPTWGVFLDKEKQGGGPLIDIGTHALDIALWTMDNYKPKQVSGSVFHKMKDNYEGNLFGPWNTETIDVEDSAFGFIKMENGATIFLEASWALNILKPREGQVTLCGTKSGAELVGDGAAAPTSAVNGTGSVAFNTARFGELVDIEPFVLGGPGLLISDAILSAWPMLNWQLGSMQLKMIKNQWLLPSKPSSLLRSLKPSTNRLKPDKQ